MNATIKRFKLIALGFLSALLTFKWLRADFEMKGKWSSFNMILNLKRIAFAGFLLIIAIHCANCQTPHVVKIDTVDGRVIYEKYMWNGLEWQIVNKWKGDTIQPTPKVIPPDEVRGDTVFDITWWYHRMIPNDSSQTDSMDFNRMTLREIRDTMEIIAILPDWETGQVETVKGRMVKLRESFGWQFYIARQKCGEVPVKVGKKTIYEYKCETVYQPIDSQKFADYYIKPPTYPEK